MSKYLTRDFLRKLDPTVYEKAAERIKNDRDTFSCWAIEHAAIEKGVHYFPYDNAYYNAFGPKSCLEEDKHPFWNKGLYRDVPARSARRYKRERIMALLTMAAMVRYAKNH
jgi:hypothetical protein